MKSWVRDAEEDLLLSVTSHPVGRTSRVEILGVVNTGVEVVQIGGKSEGIDVVKIRGNRVEEVEVDGRGIVVKKRRHVGIARGRGDRAKE